jgi:hypothetical protein
MLSATPTSTLIKKPSDGLKPPEVIPLKREFERGT